MSENEFEAQDWTEVSVVHTEERAFRAESVVILVQVKMALELNVSIYTDLGSVFYSHSSEKEILYQAY